jgi:hypothetical protein
MKTESEVQHAIEMVKTNQVKMDKWLWNKTVGKLYSSEEKDRLVARIHEVIANLSD